MPPIARYENHHKPVSGGDNRFVFWLLFYRPHVCLRASSDDAFAAPSSATVKCRFVFCRARVRQAGVRLWSAPAHWFTIGRRDTSLLCD